VIQFAPDLIEAYVLEGRAAEASEVLVEREGQAEATGGTWAAAAAARCRGQLAAEQELQVALQVAAGATNREAAGALFLSPKTIEAHLSRVYRKLGVRSRTELALRFTGDAAAAGSTPPEVPV
jgi:DNA-binding NarL/FixJ family response regulator